jgi:hypothetical protein
VFLGGGGGGLLLATYHTLVLPSASNVPLCIIPAEWKVSAESELSLITLNISHANIYGRHTR